jgi:hypothetical protein
VEYENGTGEHADESFYASEPQMRCQAGDGLELVCIPRQWAGMCLCRKMHAMRAETWGVCKKRFFDLRLGL